MLVHLDTGSATISELLKAKNQIDAAYIAAKEYAVRIGTRVSFPTKSDTRCIGNITKINTKTVSVNVAGTVYRVHKALLDIEEAVYLPRVDGVDKIAIGQYTDEEDQF